jgi:hypothetical protein
MPGGKRGFSRSGDTISKWDAILPAHHVAELAIPCGARLDDIATPGKLDAFVNGRQVDLPRNYGSQRPVREVTVTRRPGEASAAFAEFAVLF